MKLLRVLKCTLYILSIKECHDLNQVGQVAVTTKAIFKETTQMNTVYGNETSEPSFKIYSTQFNKLVLFRDLER